MALKKPSELLNKKETSGVFEKPEVSSHITESYDKFRNNFEKVNELSEKVEVLTQELSEKLTKSDLENAMLSQLMVLDENFKSLQNQVKGLNKQDLAEFKETVSNLSEIVDNLVETELPRYKKQITKNELYVGEQVHQLQEVVETNILGIREEIDEKFDNIADVVDNNIEYFNQKLGETSSQVKKTTETYHNLSKIVENKVSKENERLEEYGEIIESLTQAFEELSYSLKEELNTSSQLTEEKFEEYRNQFESISSGLEKSIDNRLEGYRKQLVDVKAEVAINEQHIKNVDKYLQEYHQDLEELKEEVFSEIEKLPVGNFQENLERLEKKIDFIKETYSKIEPDVVVKEVIKEGLLNEPPSTNNSDPLTPLDQNFVTLDQLQQHYRLFLNRIQQQLSTLGGGGETQLKYLDDIVGIATNASAYDGKFLKYNDTLGKFEFVDILGAQSLNDVLGIGNTSALGMSVGVVTATSFVGNLSGNASSASYASVAGISTVSQGLTGTPNITVGIVTATSFSTGGIGSAINITNDSITGPTEIILDPKTIGDNTGIVRIKGDLYVDGNATYINSTVVEIADYQVGIATTVGTNVLLDGAGIGIGSVGIRKTITWDNSNSALKSSENWNLDTGKVYEIDGATVLSSTTLGSGVTSSSLTSVGTLSNLNVSGVTTTGNLNVGIGTISLASRTSGTYINFGNAGTLNATAGGAWLSFNTTLVANGFRVGNNGVIEITDGPGTSATVIRQDAANTLAQRNGTNAQTFRIYNTYTSATNFERANIGWSASNPNVFIVGTEKGSSIGTARQMEFQTDGTTRVAITTTGLVGIATTNPITTLDVRGSASFTDTRLNSVSEKSTLVSGNTVNLVYNTGGGNVAICTNPTGPITLNVTGIPTDSSFDNRVLTFTVIVIQGATGYACTTVNLNGVPEVIRYPGGVVSVGSSDAYDIFNFTGINTVGSASTAANYQVLGMVNGNFR